MAGDDYAAWLGRCETRTDVAGRDRIAGLEALLDRPEQCSLELPLLGHWLLAPPRVRQSHLDDDGHPIRNGESLLPPISLPRRMWAGSDVTCLSPIAIDASVERRSTVVSIQEKLGSTGPLVFVVIEHEIRCADVVAVRERQNLVYRGRGAVLAEPKLEIGIPSNSLTKRLITPDPIQLFRYSSLTFNAHRIHYDRDYARNIEGYPGLVVHGPYVATLLLDHYRQTHPDHTIEGFSFRARAPLYDIAPFSLCTADNKLWAVDVRGSVAVEATVQLSSH